MDFFTVRERINKNGVIEIYPDFKVCRSKDLMIRAKSFYAIWDEALGMWSTDEYDVQRLVDKQLWDFANKYTDRGQVVSVHSLSSYASGSWAKFRSFLGHLTDNSTQLDEKLTFSNTLVTKEDHVSKRLPYELPESPSVDAWNELAGTLYDDEQRRKFEWAIGAIVAGESIRIQKFIVFYGPPGSGKGTIIGILESLFEGYVAAFNAKDLTSGSNQFATEPFRENPLVAIDHDADLSRISDNTRLNSIVSHETILINEKNKPTYASKINAFILAGSNKAVKITDAKSGIIRRLIDVHPSGNKIPPRKYQALMSQIQFELGSIAAHCLALYRELGRDYYEDYRPIEMMLETDIFYNFIEDSYDVFQEHNGTSLSQAYAMYKDYCAESMIEYKLPLHKFREELKSYFKNFDERARIDGLQVRSWYSDFKSDIFTVQVEQQKPVALILDETESLLDKMLSDCLAVYSAESGAPSRYWDGEPRMKNGVMFTPEPSQIATTHLDDLDTTKEHYVKPPLNHIVIDFDYADENGNKDAAKNLEMASLWPPTYAEYSKSGAGIHLHYLYRGDANELSRIFSEFVEIKVFNGNGALRRRLSRCNNIPVAELNGGLPLKEKKMVTDSSIKSERSLRELIDRNLRKEIHAGTKPSMDFIKKILDDVYTEEELDYDLSDYKSKILVFANNSTNQSMYCLSLLPHIKFKSKKREETPEGQIYEPDPVPASSAFVKAERLVAYFDVEVFRNVFIVCVKVKGAETRIRLINPSPTEVQNILDTFRLVGYNCRRYDNHIMHAARLGFNNEELYRLSKSIIDNAPNTLFADAYNLSYADIYDYASIKQSLKKWMIDLGITHIENHYDWDEPLPEEAIPEVVDYCMNDVEATEAVAEETEQDFVARQILAELSGLEINSSTNSHSARIIFEGTRDTKDDLVYTNLATGASTDGRHSTIVFEGYKFENGVSTYRGEEIGEGGLVRAKPGIYENVGVLDVESMHPTSAVRMNLFGRYTKNFEDLLNARLAIKHGDYEAAGKMFGGALKKYLVSKEQADALSYALKIVINSVYGLTSARFPNPFKDVRNKDNIVAKRGALFMKDLIDYVESLGYLAIHIKTDSIKIPNIDDYIIEKVCQFGVEYGYKFEHEATYSKMALVNDAVYIAHIGWHQKAHKIGKWDAVGAQFQHPYVFKSLFSNEKLIFENLCETKSVTSTMYMYTPSDDIDTPMALAKDIKELTTEDARFIGKVGSFVPVADGGSTLLREKDGKFYAVTGTKGYSWIEREVYRAKYDSDGHMDLTHVDYTYFNKLADDAIAKIQQFGDFEEFVRLD